MGLRPSGLARRDQELFLALAELLAAAGRGAAFLRAGRDGNGARIGLAGAGISLPAGRPAPFCAVFGRRQVCVERTAWSAFWRFSHLFSFRTGAGSLGSLVQ
ncbi:hypothetical protein LP419_34020 [Massilia sp. H-1]|nr:hypothetical protein LP419_34020 [Massilia sp. H-1]